MVTISDGKVFSLGLDVDLMVQASAEELMQYMVDLQKLYCRMLTFPLVTVAAVNGVFAVQKCVIMFCTSILLQVISMQVELYWDYVMITSL